MRTMRYKTSRPWRWALAAAMLLALLSVSVLAEEAADANDNKPVERIPEFIASKEWKELLPGQGVPAGLHIRLNLETGKREAKLIDENENDETEAVMRDVSVTKDASVTVATDVTGEIDAVVAPATASQGLVAVVDDPDELEAFEEEPTTATSTNNEPQSEASEQSEGELDPSEPNWNHEKMYEVLEALPEPPTVDGMDIHEARAKLAEPEFRRQMIKIWKRRQEELKEAMDSMQNDAKYLASLLDQFREAEQNGSTEDQVRVLEVLEWEVQDLDKTHVFNYIGGFDILAEYLNSTNLPVRASASWVIGSAVKNYKDGQDWAIDAGVMPKLIHSLALPVEDSESAEEVIEVKKKALYALASLVRFNERGQRLFVLHNGPAVLGDVFNGKHPQAFQIKAALLAHDLLLEEVPAQTAEAGESSLQTIQEELRSAAWCQRLSSFFMSNVAQLQNRHSVELLSAQYAQLPACQAIFQDAGLKTVIEGLAAKWANDELMDDEDKQELAAFAEAFLAQL